MEKGNRGARKGIKKSKIIYLMQNSTDMDFSSDLQLHWKATDLLACHLLLTALAGKNSSEKMVAFTKKNLK